MYRLNEYASALKNKGWDSAAAKEIALLLGLQFGCEDADAAIDTLPPEIPDDFNGSTHVSHLKSWAANGWLNARRDGPQFQFEKIAQATEWMASQAPMTEAFRESVEQTMADAYWGSLESCIESAVESRQMAAPQF